MLCWWWRLVVVSRMTKILRWWRCVLVLRMPNMLFWWWRLVVVSRMTRMLLVAAVTYRDMVGGGFHALAVVGKHKCKAYNDRQPH